MASGRKPETPSLEQAGIHPGSGLLATAEEVEAIDAAEAARVSAANADLDAGLGRLWSCQCCGVPGAAAFESDGLCPSCRVVVRRLEAERLGAEQVDGTSRAELAATFLDRRTT